MRNIRYKSGTGLEAHSFGLCYIRKVLLTAGHTKNTAGGPVGPRVLHIDDIEIQDTQIGQNPKNVISLSKKFE